MPRSLRALVSAAAMILFLLSSGCSEKLAKQKGLTDSALFARGQQSMERKKFDDAAEAFQLLVERFPNSPLAPRAQLNLASSRVNLKEYVEAEVAFDDFLRLYPADPKVPDALFQKGELLYQQILAPGRSQEKTRESIETYKRFLEKEKGTPRAEAAASRIKEMRAHLLLHEETIISHLLSRKMFESAELRARRALEDYPDVAPTPQLLSMLALALGGQGKKEESAQVQTELATKFPDAGDQTQQSIFSSFSKALGSAKFQGRQRRHEITLSPLYMASKEIGVSGGSKLDLDSAFGFGVGYGYNFTDHFALQLNGTWSHSDYTASIPATAGGVTTQTTADGTLDFGTLALNTTYYFLKGPLTPFITGGIGWTLVDSNIPSGPEDDVCWYDPWYGDVCESYENTYIKSYFSYNLGFGVRWDVRDGFFLRGSVGWQWVNLGRPGTTDFMGGRLDLGYMF